MFWAVGWQECQFDDFTVPSDPLLDELAMVNTQIVHGECDLASGIPDKPSRELDKDIRFEAVMVNHPVHFALVGDRSVSENPNVMGKHRLSHLKVAVLKAFRQRRAAKEKMFEHDDATFRLRTPHHGRLKTSSSSMRRKSFWGCFGLIPLRTIPLAVHFDSFTCRIYGTDISPSF